MQITDNARILWGGIMEWFSVDKEGLKELQAGKPKHYILRELVQNCFDEPVTEVKLHLGFNKGIIKVMIEDDSPIGFRDMKDSYTLFKHSYKRQNPEKRGKFNVGEKFAISRCLYAKVETTKGTVIFDDNGRTELTNKTAKGTVVTVKLKATEKEVEEMKGIIRTYLPPKKVKFIVNNELVPYKKPFKTFEAKLITETEKDKILQRTVRKTKVDVLETDKSYLYEMGIPVQEIDCKYSIDVQQKIPLSIDRETVSSSFLRDLYAEVLNTTYGEIDSEDSSQLWVREALSDERISKDAAQGVIKARYGDNVCVANPFDRHSIDEALSKGYNVIFGSEMSKEEWNNIKRDDLISSSSELFGSDFTNAMRIEPDDNQRKVADFAKKIARRLLGIDIKVEFVKGGYNMVTAQFGNNTLTFNVDRLNGLFDNPINTIGLILHELAHSKGSHTEYIYHETLTEMAQELIIIALNEPTWFNL